MTEFRPTSFQILPVVIKNLLIINVLVFLAQNTLGASGLISMEDLFGLHHVNSPLFQPWQIITHLFMHGDFMHLFGNMFALWMFGARLENLWGPKRFLTFYFLCGIGAALIQLASLWLQYAELSSQFMAIKLHPTPEGMISFYQQFGLDKRPHNVEVLQSYLDDPGSAISSLPVIDIISQAFYKIIGNATIGASGAVFGILAAFIYLYPNTYIYLYFLFPIKTKWIGLMYFGSEIYAGIVNSAGDNIAHWAHIGGGLVGFLLVLTWNRKNRRNFY